MPSTSEAAGIPPEVASVTGRYHRVERAVSWLVALLVVGVALTAIRMLDPVPALSVLIAVVAVVRVPVLRRDGSARLVADADPTAVVSAFRSATPPVLVFQWGIADGVAADGDEDDGPVDRATYEIAYLFGLRSVTMDVEVRPASASGGGDATGADGSGPVERLEVSATANGRPWGTYLVSIREGDAGTVVDVAVTTDRRFDLRSVPQTLVADRYYAEALAAQGYRVDERTVSWST